MMSFACWLVVIIGDVFRASSRRGCFQHPTAAGAGSTSLSAGQCNSTSRGWCQEGGMTQVRHDRLSEGQGRAARAAVAQASSEVDVTKFVRGCRRGQRSVQRWRGRQRVDSSCKAARPAPNRIGRAKPERQRTRQRFYISRTREQHTSLAGALAMEISNKAFTIKSVVGWRTELTGLASCFLLSLR